MMVGRDDGGGDNVERDVFLTRSMMELKNTVGDRAFKRTSKQVHKCEQVDTSLRVIGNVFKVMILGDVFGVVKGMTIERRVKEGRCGAAQREH
jgi:hypothetical protein